MSADFPLMLGITGLIGSGKSTVSQILRDEGVVVWDADQIVHELYRRDEGLMKWIAKEFGNHLVKEEGIDRKALAEIVFSERKKLMVLEKKVHEKVYLSLKDRLQKSQEKGKQYLGLEALFIIGNAVENLCYHVICVSAKESLRIKRIIKRSGLSEGELRKRIENQGQDEVLRKQADSVLENNSDYEELKKQTLLLWNSIKKGVNF